MRSSSGAHRLKELNTPRRERNAAETRQRILNAAEVEFAKKGYDGARLGAIARAASVQQALIHHYFDDKEGLYREVIDRALGAMSVEGWDVLHRFEFPIDASRIPELVEAFVDLLIYQLVQHAAALAILQHAEPEEEEGAASARASRASPEVLLQRILREKTKPMMDAVVALLDELRTRGQIRADVDARHLCISTMSLVMGTVQEERLLRAIWGIEVRSPEFLRERKSEIIATVLARIAVR